MKDLKFLVAGIGKLSLEDEPFTVPNLFTKGKQRESTAI